jgi:tetratricopeptide (TPR) repeat protein
MASPIYFFLHVPKTAGQTIRLHLSQYAPQRIWATSPSRLADRLAGRGYALKRFPDPDSLLAVSGHDLGRSLERHFAGREIRRVALLREPLDLQLSLYNFRMMSYLSRGLGTYSFELHLKSLPRNFMCHFLLRRWLEIPWRAYLTMSAEEQYRALNEALAEFWFVGPHRDCGRVIAAVAPEFGAPALALKRNTAEEWLAQVEWRPLTREELSPATRDLLIAHNPLDLALWENWRGAGFAPAKVRPLPFDPRWRANIAAGEARRLGYGAKRHVRRDLARPSAIAGAWLVSRADRARDAQDWAEAAHRYGKAVALRPTPALWMQYAHTLRDSGEPARAEDAYRQTLALKPDNREALTGLGEALALLGRNDEAAEAYLRAASLGPALSDPRAGLIRLGWSDERIDRALAGAETR